MTSGTEAYDWSWAAPTWNFSDDSDVVSRQQLFWRGAEELVVAGKPGVLVSIRVEVDELGRLVDDTWEAAFRPPGTDKDHPAEWAWEEPLWPELEALWRDYADRTWLEARRDMLRMSLASPIYRVRGIELPPDLADRRRQLKVLQHAYKQDERVLAQAVRLAASWTGTVEEFRSTLPSILAR